MKPFILVACLAGVSACGLTERAFAQSGGMVRCRAAPTDAGLEITADKFEVDQKSGWTRPPATCAHQDRRARDECRPRAPASGAGDVQARGNVVLRQRGFGAWTGDYIEYNYKTGKGAHRSRRTAGRRLSHRRERGDAPRGRLRFDAARYAEITTCTNSPGHRHWRMTWPRALQGQRLRRGLRRRPLFRRAVRLSPLLVPRPGHALRIPLSGARLHSRWGAYLLGGYVYNIYESPHEAGCWTAPRTSITAPCAAWPSAKPAAGTQGTRTRQA